MSEPNSSRRSTGVRKTVGVLGGMGPEATLDFFARVLRGTDADSDQGHIHLLIDNDPSVPNRNRAVAGLGPSPAPRLAEMARRLELAGADFLVMVCNAAHAFQDAIEAAASIPFVSMIAETRDRVVRAHPTVKRVGLLASTGCVDAGLYQRAFEESGVAVVVPEGTHRERFMELLYGIKAGNKSEPVRRGMREIAAKLVEDGSEVLVAGCTEVPLVLGNEDVPRPLVDATDVLVEVTIARALGA